MPSIWPDIRFRRGIFSMWFGLCVFSQEQFRGSFISFSFVHCLPLTANITMAQSDLFFNILFSADKKTGRICFLPAFVIFRFSYRRSRNLYRSRIPCRICSFLRTGSSHICNRDYYIWPLFYSFLVIPA